MDSKDYIGVWKIFDVKPMNGPKSDAESLIGLEFELYDDGHVEWRQLSEAICQNLTSPNFICPNITSPKSDNCKADVENPDVKRFPTSSLNEQAPFQKIPLLDCSAYEVVIGKKTIGKSDSNLSQMRFAAVRGQVINFEVRSNPSNPDVMQLTYENWSNLFCRKIGNELKGENHFELTDSSYHMLAALEEGFFADLTLKASNGREFHVHSTIVGLTLPSRYWTEDKSFWSNLSEEIVSLILHFIYGQCLPESLSLETAKECVEVAGKIPQLQELVKACKTFLRNKPLMNQIMYDVSVIKDCCNEAIVAFGGKVSNSSKSCKQSRRDHKEDSVPAQDLFHSPSRVEAAFKQVLKNMTIGFLHFVHLSSNVSQALKLLSDAEYGKILIYLKSELKEFLHQIHKFLQTLKHAVPSLNLTVRLELAEHLLGSFECLMQLICLACSSFKKIFKASISDLRSPVEARISGLRSPVEAVSEANEGVEAVESVEKDLDEQAFDDETTDKRKIPESLNEMLLRRSEYELAHIFYHFAHMHISFGEDSFFFHREEMFENGESNKVASFAWTMEQYAYEIPVLLFQLEAFQYLFEQQLDMKSFKFGITVVSSCVDYYLSKCVVHRPLLIPLLDHVTSLTGSRKLVQILKTLNLLETDASNPVQTEYEDIGLNWEKNDKLLLTQSLFLPKRSENNPTANNCSELFQSMIDTDMQLFVQSSDCSPPNMDEIINCHRVVIASRCPWFRRALLAGMKESRERRMMISDASPWSVRQFVRFLYSGILVSTEENPLGMDQLLELMILADRFEMDSLKDVCQERLKNLINQKYVFGLLYIADQYTAGNLRATCIAFFLDNSSLASISAKTKDDSTNSKKGLSCSKNESFCSKNESVCSKNESICSKNESLCSKNDEIEMSFDDLSQELQCELKDLIRWSKSTPEDFESIFKNFQIT